MFGRGGRLDIDSERGPKDPIFTANVLVNGSGPHSLYIHNEKSSCVLLIKVLS